MSTFKASISVPSAETAALYLSANPEWGRMVHDAADRLGVEHYEITALEVLVTCEDVAR